MGGETIRPPPGHFTEDWKPDNFDIKQVFVSASPVYAGEYAEETELVFISLSYTFHSICRK